MMEIIALLASLAVIVFFGWNAFLLICGSREDMGMTGSIAISYILGVGLISLEMLAFYFFKLPLKLAFIIAPWSMVLIFNAFTGNFNRSPSSFSWRSRASSSEKSGALSLFLTAGIAFEVSYAFFRALIKPIESYDAIAIYAIKSKIFYTAGAFTTEVLNVLKALYPHPDYPLNIPLIETFLYLGMGSLNDQLVKIIFPLFFVSVLTLMYHAVRRLASRTYALLFVFILATIPQFNAYAANAYHELPLACYYFASALFLFRWFENTDEVWCLSMSAVLIGLAGWTKNEGLLYCVINMAVLGIFLVFNFKKVDRKNIFHVAAYPIIIVAVLLPWLGIKKIYGLTNSDVSISNLNPLYMMDQLHRLGPIFYEFQKQFFGPKKWNIIWPAAAFVIAVNYRKAFGGVKKYVALSLCFAVSGYILFYLTSNLDVVYFLGKTWSRFLLHFLPVVVYWIALILKDEVKV